MLRPNDPATQQRYMLRPSTSALEGTYRRQLNLSGDLRGPHVEGVLRQTLLLRAAGVGGRRVRGELLREALRRGGRRRAGGRLILQERRRRRREQRLVDPRRRVGRGGRGGEVLPGGRSGVFRRGRGAGADGGAGPALRRSPFLVLAGDAPLRVAVRPLRPPTTALGGPLGLPAGCVDDGLQGGQRGLLVEQLLDVGPRGP